MRYLHHRGIAAFALAGWIHHEGIHGGNYVADSLAARLRVSHSDTNWCGGLSLVLTRTGRDCLRQELGQNK